MSHKPEDNSVNANVASDVVLKDQRKEDGDEISDELVEETLFRLTRGIPKRELKLMISESEECEKLLEEDIAILERALQHDATSKESDHLKLQIIMDSPLTPIDRYWTASALLGRMRRDMMLPSIHSVPGGDPRLFPSHGAVNAASQTTNNKKNSNAPASSANLESQSAQELVDLSKHDVYTQRQPNSSAQLLALWKKISSNRAAHVFKRPVRPEEAPGYTDRIVFPMDLSLIRKLIVSNKINTFQQLHDKIGLICHNCVKYNGRETDYGRVARDFEAMADEYIRQVIYNSMATQQPQNETVAQLQSQLVDPNAPTTSQNNLSSAPPTNTS